jgi:hypothetical protein
MTQKGSRKMSTRMSDHSRKEERKRRKKVDRAKIDIKYIESEQRQNVRLHRKGPCFI